MEETGLKLREQFCDDIETAAQTSYVIILMEIENVLELYDNDNEKLKYIESQRIKVREKLKDSIYIKMCSSDDLIAELTNVLQCFFKLEKMSNAMAVECSETLELGQHEYDPETGKLVVPYDSWYSGEEPNFNFAEFQHFEALTEYIKFSMLFIELRKLEAEIKKKQIVDPKIRLPQINNEVADGLETSQDKRYQGILSKTETTIDFLKGSDSEKLKLLEYLKKKYAGKKGKNIAIMILALKYAGKISYFERKELYSALRKDFGYIGSDTSINNYIIDTNSGNTKKDKEYKKTILEHAEIIKTI